MYKDHNCGELNSKDINKVVKLAGWVQTRRDHGGIIFIDLRDRYGITQVVIDPSKLPEGDKLRREWVVSVNGKVVSRPEGMKNPKMKTGDVEVHISELEVLNESETPPFEIENNIDVNEDVRLKYRYLDLRRPVMQERLALRHKIVMAVHEYMNSQSFLEVETPMFVKTTPGGARVFKVPSRVNTGKFYALPESPQMYKQLLMVAGCDRYYQLARCLRDEDLRADRQPEFTQIDIEMSFVNQTKDVQDVIEGLLKNVFLKSAGIEIITPFLRISYYDAMEKYGSDKPDLRFGLELSEVTSIVHKSEFSVFKNAEVVKCICVPGGARFSRKELEELEGHVKIYKAKGLAYLKAVDGKLDSSVAKYFNSDLQKELINATKAKNGDLLLFVADKKQIVYDALGALRLELGKRLKLIDENMLKFCWVVDFPLYEEADGKWQARHHIFTMPNEEDMDLLEKDPEKVRAKLYDVVLNGWELGGGSVRIHKKDIQTRTLKVIGLTYEEACKKFDFLLDAFQYGAPPHGGIALGLDRLVALIAKTTDIRDVIAYPKNKAAENPMDGSPQDWTPEFLKELHIKLDTVVPKK